VVDSYTCLNIRRAYLYVIVDLLCFFLSMWLGWRSCDYCILTGGVTFVAVYLLNALVSRMQKPFPVNNLSDGYVGFM
jgi:hypothetical protein